MKQWFQKINPISILHIKVGRPKMHVCSNIYMRVAIHIQNLHLTDS